jgi:hypothetical protein
VCEFAGYFPFLVSEGSRVVAEEELSPTLLYDIETAEKKRKEKTVRNKGETSSFL